MKLFSHPSDDKAKGKKQTNNVTQRDCRKRALQVEILFISGMEKQEKLVFMGKTITNGAGIPEL